MSAAISADSAPVDWRSYRAPSVPPLLQSAVETFVKEGYHGSSMRTLASRVGLSVPGIYHHYDSKQAILVAIMRFAMRELHDRSMAALAEAGDAVEEKARLHIECLVLFHANRRDLAFIAESEIRSLETEARRNHIAARDRQQRILEEIVEEGVQRGRFSVASVRETTRALITMCTGVAKWFKNSGPLTAEEIAAQYVVIAFRALGVPELKALVSFE
jgi:AcrR family transcriptional regulator